MEIYTPSCPMRHAHLARFIGDQLVQLSCIASDDLVASLVAQSSPVKAKFRGFAPKSRPDIYSIEDGPTFTHTGDLSVLLAVERFEVSLLEPAFWTWFILTGEATKLGISADLARDCGHGLASLFPSSKKRGLIRAYLNWASSVAAADVSSVRSTLRIRKDKKETDRAYNALDAAGENKQVAKFKI